MSGNKIILTLVASFLTLTLSIAQSKGEFQKKYASSLDQFKKGDYTHSYEGFRLLTQGNKNNVFEEYAHYYCGYSAWKIGKILDAKFILVNAIKKFPEWKQVSEVKFLLARIAASEKEYDRTFSLLSEISEKEFEKDKRVFIRKVVLTALDIEPFILLQTNYPENQVLAEALADKIREAPSSSTRMLLSYLIQDYELDPKKYEGALRKLSVKKPEYNVAVLLPFNIQDKMNWRRSGRELEMYEGIRLAVENYNEKKGAKFNVLPYDTKRDTGHVKALLALPEMANMDLIIGPSRTSTSKIVSRFSEAQQIHVVNPLNGDPTLGNDYTKLFKPAYDVIGEELAQIAIDSFPKRHVVIFYNATKQDSMAAMSYKLALEASDKVVDTFKEITRKNTTDMSYVLRRVEMDSLSHIAVFNKEDLVATSFMSALEGRIATIESDEDYEGGPIDIPVIAPIEWLDIYIIQFEQFIRRRVHFYDPSYIDLDGQKVSLFRGEMKERLGIKPSGDYAAIGYDMMWYFARVMNKYGNVFTDELGKEVPAEGVNFTTINFLNSNSNTVVPLLKLDKEYRLVRINQ